jgi:hypothetical protein
MPWTEPPHAAAVRQGGIALTKFALQSPELDVRPEIRTEMMRLYVLPLVTHGTAGSKYETRFRSLGALHVTDAAELQHEHVFTRKWLIDTMQANPTDAVIEWIMTNLTIACTVTVDEHARLTKFDRTHQGWERYAAAGVEVFDMTTGEPVELEPQDVPNEW